MLPFVRSRVSCLIRFQPSAVPETAFSATCASLRSWIAARAATMAHSAKNARNRKAKTILRLPDLEHSETLSS